MRFSQLNRNTKAILGIQSICMLMGTSTHVVWVLQNGFLSEAYGVAWPSRLFWDALTFLDPLAAVLLFVRPRAGIYLTAGIISADVLHNTLVHASELFDGALHPVEWIVYYWAIWGQWVFALFVWITFKRNLKAV